MSHSVRHRPQFKNRKILFCNRILSLDQFFRPDSVFNLSISRRSTRIITNGLLIEYWNTAMLRRRKVLIGRENGNILLRAREEYRLTVSFPFFFSLYFHTITPLRAMPWLSSLSLADISADEDRFSLVSEHWTRSSFRQSVLILLLKLLSPIDQLIINAFTDGARHGK